MRDDPIVNEDWKVGYSDYVKVRWLYNLDFSVSSLIIFIFLILSFDSQNFFAVFLWIFGFAMIILTELVLNQPTRSLLDRLLVLIALYGLMVISFPNIMIFQLSVDMIITAILLTFKMMLIPAIQVSKLYHAEILTPKQPAVAMTLKQHISFLSETDYRLESAEESRKNLTKIFIQIVTTFSVGLGVFLLTLLLGFTQIPQLFIIVTTTLLYIPALTLLGIGLTWYYENRRQLGPKLPKNKEEKYIEPLFPIQEQ